MRQIKFRAWLKDEKKMIEWYPEFFSDMSPVTSYGSDFPDSDDVVLMQFTGLHDKNGKEIYEGDLVYSNSWNPDTMEVVFVEGAFMLAYEGCEPYYTDLYYAETEFEIIGNIHEEKQ